MMMKTYEKIAQLVMSIKNCQKSGNTEWIEKHTNALSAIDLPHGSGFDAGCHVVIDESSDQRLVIQADFHAMNENGYYCGWKEYRVIVRPNLIYGIAIRVDGRDFNGLKDYISDVFYDVLNREI